MFGLSWNRSNASITALKACQWGFKTPPCKFAQINSQLSLSQLKHVRCRIKPNTFQMIDVLKLWADNYDNHKTQMFAYALCQWIYASTFEIFGDMLKRHRLNCYISISLKKRNTGVLREFMIPNTSVYISIEYDTCVSYIFDFKMF